MQLEMNLPTEKAPNISTVPDLQGGVKIRMAWHGLPWYLELTLDSTEVADLMIECNRHTQEKTCKN